MKFILPLLFAAVVADTTKDVKDGQLCSVQALDKNPCQTTASCCA